MDSSAVFGGLINGLDKCERRYSGLYGANDSGTSYEDIPGVDRLNNGSSTDAMGETNRGAVMHALKNLQDKIQRLEIERSGAESDMRHLASETARFRKLLNNKDENNFNQHEPCEETMRTLAQQKNERTVKSLSFSASNPFPETNEYGPLNSSKPQTVVLGSSKAKEMALASAETRCTILEKQLAYMRTLLETAERDRNEAQRRSRNRGEQMVIWRQKAETHLKGLEDELRSERQQNRHLRDNISLSAVQWYGSETNLKEKAASHNKRNVEVAEEKEWRQFMRSPNPNQNGNILITSTPRTKVAEPAFSKGLVSSNIRHPSRPNFSREKSPSSGIPFVVGQSVGPSHNVNVNLQTVLSMLTKHGTPVEKSSASKRQRQVRNHQVDKQMREDVGVVLEELVEEFDQLCREHQVLVHRLADATADLEKSSLEQRLSDLVNKMEMKGQQIGRLRSYMTNFCTDWLSGNPRNSKVTIKTTSEPQPSPQCSSVMPSPQIRTVGTEKKERSLNLLKSAKQWQACNLESKDISWR